MRVFLFGLSPRRTNLINPSTELVQLILPYLRITHYLIPHFMLVFVCSRHNFRYFLSQFYQYMCVCLCMPLGTCFTTRWVASDSPCPTCSDPRVWTEVDPSIEDQAYLVGQVPFCPVPFDWFVRFHL